MRFTEFFEVYRQVPRITEVGLVCEMFRGADQGAVIASLSKTPGGSDSRAIISVNEATALKIASISSDRLAHGSYDHDPTGFESDARRLFLDAAPELAAAIMFAKAADVPVIEVRNLPSPKSQVRTPSDGVVAEQDVRRYVLNLVGTLGGAWGLCGFSYESENEGRLLRAISPVQTRALEASSQGFADDLGWHQDNANRRIPGVPDTIRNDRGPMNAYQAFVCVRPDPDVPMDLVTLADIAAEAAKRHGSMLIDALAAPDFAINRPDSHGGGRDVEEVPLLVRDAAGRLYGRFHAGNVVGLTPEAQAAYEAFRQIATATRSTMEVQGERGALLMYSNTRTLHRRRRFAPRFDGADRYYVRLYMMDGDEMQEHEAHLHGRTFR